MFELYDTLDKNSHTAVLTNNLNMNYSKTKQIHRNNHARNHDNIVINISHANRYNDSALLW